MQNKYKYDAFISYRHLSPDRQVAQKLQNLLETFVPPKSLNPDGSFRKFRLFRDTTELPVNGDLGGAITDALESSRFLIVVCSEKTKQSKWCMQEIEYFKKIHGGNNDRILTIVADGLPENVFPDELRYEKTVSRDENGNEVEVINEIEPLAANVASDSTGKTLRKLNTEYLKLAAPLLGCDYDDLYQRATRREMKKRIAALSVTAAILFLFALISTVSLITISSQKRSLLIEKSGLLASESVNYSNDGRIYDALISAYKSLSGAPTVTGIKQAALLTGAYEPDAFLPVTEIENEAVIDEIHLLESGSRLVTADRSDTLCLWDTQTGEKISSYDSGYDAYLVYGASEVESVKFLKFYSGVISDDTGINLGYKKIIGDEKQTGQDALFLLTDNKVRKVNLSDGSILWTAEEEVAPACSFTDGEKLIYACDNYSETDIVILDAQTGKELKRASLSASVGYNPEIWYSAGKPIVFAEGGIIVFGDEDCSSVLFSSPLPDVNKKLQAAISGNLLFVCGECQEENSVGYSSYYKVFNLKTGKEVAGGAENNGNTFLSPGLKFGNHIFTLKKSDTGADSDVLVWAYMNKVTFFDTSDFSVIESLDLPGSVTYAYYSKNGAVCLGLSCGNEVLIPYTKEFIPKILYNSCSFGFPAEYASYKNNLYALSPSEGNRVYICRSEKNGDKFRIGDGIQTDYEDFTWNPEKKEAVYGRYTDGADKKEIYIYDIRTGKEKKIADTESDVSISAFCSDGTVWLSDIHGSTAISSSDGKTLCSTEKTDKFCIQTGEALAHDNDKNEIYIIKPDGSAETCAVFEKGADEGTRVYSYYITASDDFGQIFSQVHISAFGAEITDKICMRLYRRGSEEYKELEIKEIDTDEWIKTALFSPDGKKIAFLSGSRTVIEADTETGEYEIFTHSCDIAGITYFEGKLYIIDVLPALECLNAPDGEEKRTVLDDSMLSSYSAELITADRISDTTVIFSVGTDTWAVDMTAGEVVYTFYGYNSVSADGRYIYLNNESMYAYPVQDADSLLKKLEQLPAVTKMKTD